MVKFAPVLLLFLLTLTGCGSGRRSSSADSLPAANLPASPAVEAPKPPEPPKAVEAKVEKLAPRVHPKPVYEDPRRIPAGIAYGEMVRRFGPPSMKVTVGPTRSTFSYSKLKTQVQVDVENGKVVSVAAVNTGL